MQPLTDPYVVKLRVPKDEDLGAFMGKVRVWLDSKHLYARPFTTSADARGYTLTVGLPMIAAADRFRREFRSNISDEHRSPGQALKTGPAASAALDGRHGAA
jgi:hypothetical protein